MHPCRLADIAKKTGYSIATVSRVLSSSSSRISPETRREVLNAARSLGYRKETRNIAILIGDYGFPSYFGYILQPLCYELRKRAFVPVILHAENIHLLEELSFCAAISVMAENKLEEYWNNVHTMPLICINTRSRRMSQAYMVSSDDFQGTEQIVNHLVLMGHTRIGRLCSKNELNEANWNQKARVQTFRQVLERYGLSDRYSISPAEEAPPDALKKLIRRGISALFIQNENLVPIALKQLKLLDIRIPEDLSVVALSFPRQASCTDPPLTCIVQNYGLLASETGIMLERILTDSAAPKDVYVPYSFYDYGISVRNRNDPE